MRFRNGGNKDPAICKILLSILFMRFLWDEEDGREEADAGLSILFMRFAEITRRIEEQKRENTFNSLYEILYFAFLDVSPIFFSFQFSL